jgi:hypothetical protein
MRGDKQVRDVGDHLRDPRHIGAGPQVPCGSSKCSYGTTPPYEQVFSSCSHERSMETPDDRKWRAFDFVTWHAR